MANTSHASDCGSLRLRVVGVDWGCGGQASRDIYGRCAGSRGNGHGFRKHLRNHSINTQPIGAAWLVPVYIFKRSKHLQDGPVYFYLWIGTLVTAAIFSI